MDTTIQTTKTGTAYTLCGNPDAPVVALIHGLGLNRRIWEAFEPALTPHYRVLAYDLFGHGDSAPPPSVPSLTLFSTQLNELLDTLDIPACAAVGFSLGGMINRRFAIDHPARVTALAIFNSPHDRGRRAQQEVEARAAQSATEGIEAGVDTTLARWFTAEFQAARPDYLAATRRQLLANEPAVYAQCRQVLAAGVRELIKPRPPITTPTLVMTCEADSGSTPAMSRAIAAEIPGAQTHIVPGLKHMGLVEKPEAFTALLLELLDRALGATA